MHKKVLEKPGASASRFGTTTLEKNHEATLVFFLAHLRSLSLFLLQQAQVEWQNQFPLINQTFLYLKPLRRGGIAALLSFQAEPQ